jgi:hypothetical protein
METAVTLSRNIHMNFFEMFDSDESPSFCTTMPVVSPLTTRVRRAMNEAWNKIIVEISRSIYLLFIKMSDKNIPKAPLRAPQFNNIVCLSSRG